MQLHPKAIFPFISQDSDRKTGAFGEVFRVEIHPSHHLDPILTFNNKRSGIAVKQLKGIHSTDVATLRTLKAEWKKEVNAHIDINKCNGGLPHPNIIEFVVTITRGGDRYLLFRWADGGNLHEFWQADTNPHLSVTLVRDVVKQLRGLADALEKLHGYGGGDGSYRHGDLKPENILRVRTRAVTEGLDSDIDVGILKIADMGLAKHHTVLTELRPPTSMKYSTYRYEPPEIVLESSTKSGGRSRRQDIWSFGCITLEFIIWLLYGTWSLNEFNKMYVINELDQQCPYFEVEGKGENKRAKVHPAVSETMDLLSRDQECKVGQDSAIKDLLRIVRTKLLVVSLKTGAGSRATAGELRQALDEIVRKGEENERYWYTGQSRSSSLRLPRLRSSGPDFLNPASALGQPAPRPNRLATTPSENITLNVPLMPSLPSVTQARRNEYRNAAKIDVTNFPVDNKFANEVVKTVETEKLFPKHGQFSKRCEACQKMDFFQPLFSIKDSFSDLELKLETCDFCKLRWEVSKHLRVGNVTSVTFTRDQSMLKLNEGRIPVMSLCRSPEAQSLTANFIQIGLPKLPAAASKTHFGIARQFIQDCNANHPKCVPSKPSTMPTRLLYLGSREKPALRIYKTKTTDSFQYTALSHRWGPGPEFFCTNQKNLKEYEESISFDELPNTFKNAVETTRQLGVQYLWIDSLCIIQKSEGDDGDFATEALRMEDVFSSAYCILAASSALGPQDGFLVQRKENDFLTFEMGGQTVYVCRFMDDFDSHVLHGPLSERGWEMQERALARRTIFFTDR
ncbi:hypothetical protein ONS96_001310 [Cadophora gregata f. sp. sojae]|nr:hypothetical protein ONS96_001310 [Cadophora gregata f. sp. sojae]